jgi:2-polyprenyl-3-methyl-5-hydroxy-6-metoxy-1,4-benzoquinol methylase
MGNHQVIKLGDFDSPSARSHLFRYYAARGYIDPGDIVLDVACGAGYGTELLSEVAAKVIGMDRDKAAIEYAMNNHKKDNNYFILANLDQEPQLPECDVAISIETIEHLRYPDSFAAKLKEVARKKIIITAPIIPTKHEDSTHLHDFTEQDIIDLFTDSQWGCVDSSRQGPYLFISFYRK